MSRFYYTDARRHIYVFIIIINNNKSTTETIRTRQLSISEPEVSLPRMTRNSSMRSLVLESIFRCSGCFFFVVWSASGGVTSADDAAAAADIIFNRFCPTIVHARFSAVCRSIVESREKLWMHGAVGEKMKRRQTSTVGRRGYRAPPWNQFLISASVREKMRRNRKSMLTVHSDVPRTPFGRFKPSNRGFGGKHENAPTI